jgi:hypothetical protein
MSACGADGPDYLLCPVDEALRRIDKTETSSTAGGAALVLPL